MIWARDRVEHLAGQYHLPPPAQQRLAEHGFRHPGVVAVGGVDEIDPGGQRGIHQAGGLGLIGAAAEGHAAQADFGHLQPAVAETTVMHGSTLPLALGRLIRSAVRHQHRRPTERTVA